MTKDSIMRRFDESLASVVADIQTRGMYFPPRPSSILRAEDVVLGRGTDFAMLHSEMRGSLAKQNLTDCIFDGMKLKKLQLNSAVLRGASFRDATVVGSSFSGVRAAYSDFRGAKFDRSTQFDGASFFMADFSNVQFEGADLSNCSFTGARIQDSDFSGANLSNTSFVGADLAGSTFEGVTCENTVFAYSKNLSELSFPVLHSFIGGAIQGANFWQARLGNGKQLPKSYPAFRPSIGVCLEIAKLLFVRKMVICGMVQVPPSLALA